MMVYPPRYMHCNLPLAVSPPFSPLIRKKPTLQKKSVKGGGKKGAMGSAGFWSRLADVIHIYSSHEYERIHCIDTAGKGQRHSRLHNVIEENHCVRLSPNVFKQYYKICDTWTSYIRLM